jgi:hypothetical protein
MTSSQQTRKSRIVLYYLFCGFVVSGTGAIYAGFAQKFKFHFIGDDLASLFNSPLERLIPIGFTVNNDSENLHQEINRIAPNRINNTGESVSLPVASRDTSDTKVCRIYMAPSTIPGAGFGLFAGIPYQKGNLVTPGDGVVPIYDMEFHNGLSSSLFLWDEYVWSGSTFSAMSEYDRTIEAASFGIGALPNCFFPLLNVEDADDYRRDYANLEVTSPGIGAFSPWYDRKSYAIQNIVAGSELFVNYGYDYFKSREETYGLIPFNDHYRIADRLLKRFISVSDRLVTQDAFSKVAIMEDTFHQSRNVLIAWPNHVLGALPNTTESIHLILKNGGTGRKDYLRSIRNIDYLKNFGTCMDHLYVKPSQIPDAGRGVYTERSFEKGSIVTTVPLIHVQDRSVLNMFRYTDFVGHNDHPGLRQPTHQQLLLNYCFGHYQSSLLLCPYGIVSSLINHAPTALENEQIFRNRKNRNTANLKIKWSTAFTRHPEWLNMSVSEWASEESSGLSFEYIASRDIDPGEEILIDYGIEWQNAWNLHKKKWKPVNRMVDSLNAANLIIPTEKEWKWPIGDINSNPDAVNLWCYNLYRTLQGLENTEEEAFPCKIVHRKWDYKSETFLYTAELIQIRQNEEEFICDVIFDRVLWLLPRDAFVYGDFLDHYNTKHYLYPNSFRHNMQIPDDLMPQSCKN